MKAEAKEAAVSIVGEDRIEYRQGGEVGVREVHFPVATGRQADKSQNPDVIVLETHGLDSHRLVEKRAGKDLALAEGYRARLRLLSHLISPQANLRA